LWYLQNDPAFFRWLTVRKLDFDKWSSLGLLATDWKTDFFFEGKFLETDYGEHVVFICISFSTSSKIFCFEIGDFGSCYFFFVGMGEL
jgi:hypothetical protein